LEDLHRRTHPEEVDFEFRCSPFIEQYHRMAKDSFHLAARVRSFRFALAGIGFMLRTQHNAWLHLTATILVCVAGFVLGISATDWKWLVVAICLVWIAEAFNTAFEYLCDVVSPEFSKAVEKAKDIAAGAVFIAALAAAVLGALTFLPYLAR
jgi:diacylglycerol kinase (ATP)